MRLSSEAEEQAADFYSAVMPRLVASLHLMMGSKQDAEDIAQEAFIRLLQRWTRIARYDSPEAWLRLVAIRLALTRKRDSARRRSADVTQADCQAQTIDPGTRLDVEGLVKLLPLPQREAVVLHYLCDLSVAETAEMLGSTQSAIKKRLARARHTLGIDIAPVDGQIQSAEGI